jgi:hypothetical protein
MVKPIGYFKLWRELLTKPIWLNSTPEQKTILITLLSMANFDAREWEWKGEKYKVERGQFITSASSIIENCGQGITRQNVRTALKRFEKLEFLTYESTKKGMLITIVNWGLYQGNCDEPNQEPNQGVTKTQPRGNQRVTTKEEIKKDKKDKNDKDILSDDSIPKKEKKSNTKFNYEPEHMELAELLYSEILKNNPNHKKPDLKSWANSFRLMMERDKRTFENLKIIIQWCQADSFWYANILSADKLRKQYDQLYSKMQQQNSLKPTKSNSRTIKIADF